MREEDILAIPPKVLTQAQREFYFEKGYLLLEKAIPEDTVRRLNAITTELVEESRSLTRSDAKWDLDYGHTSQRPKLRRLTSPCDHHEFYWDYASRSLLADVVADLVGPDVRFHHSKLNFKTSEGGAEVKWHQDIQFFPHTNYSVLTVGTYLLDCGLEQAPLGVIPGSHKGELFDQYNDKGQWTGCIADRDLPRAGLERAVYLTGPAGSLTIHNCRTVHGSKPNDSPAERPLFLTTFSAADAIPYTFNPALSRYAGSIVRGKPARWAHHDGRPCLMPPDWSGGYTSIFALQQGEGAEEEEPIVAYAG